MQVLIRHFPVYFAASSLTCFIATADTTPTLSFCLSVYLIIVTLLLCFSSPFSRLPPLTHTPQHFGGKHSGGDENSRPSIHPLNHSWPLDGRRAEATTIKIEAFGLFSSQTGRLTAHSLTGGRGIHISSQQGQVKWLLQPEMLL